MFTFTFLVALPAALTYDTLNKWRCLGNNTSIGLLQVACRNWYPTALCSMTLSGLQGHCKPFPMRLFIQS